LTRFKEVTGRYPARVTAVGYDFKKERFEGMHRKALRIAPGAFRYRGFRPGGKFDAVAAEAGERANALEPFRADPYGCYSTALRAKRGARDPFRRTAPYPLSCPEMEGLLNWCGPLIYQGELPW
ncbi:unnamed protein product, partial [Discosporangium mesarthrocarpum]